MPKEKKGFIRLEVAFNKFELILVFDFIQWRFLDLNLYLVLLFFHFIFNLKENF
jgi:hypothetical protein